MTPKLPYRLWRLVQIFKWLAFCGFLFAELIIFEINPVAAVVIFVAVFAVAYELKKGKDDMPEDKPEIKITKEMITEPPKVDEIMNRYFELSDIIQHDKDDRTKLRACLESYKLLPHFVKYWLAENDELPPTILCRDAGIKLFMRAAQWANAEFAIKTCAAVGALPDDGQAALEYLHRYKNTAIILVKFLATHAGYPQKDIYKALADADQDILKEILRSSLIIKKIKSKDTNLLYLNCDVCKSIF